MFYILCYIISAYSKQIFIVNQYYHAVLYNITYMVLLVLLVSVEPDICIRNSHLQPDVRVRCLPFVLIIFLYFSPSFLTSTLFPVFTLAPPNSPGRYRVLIKALLPAQMVNL